jgi:ABC-2 type transport system permease protein
METSPVMTSIPEQGNLNNWGYDQFSRYTFANQELLMNAVTYLVSEEGLIAARNKELKIRPLDKEKN